MRGYTLIRTRLRRNLVNIHGFTLIELLVVLTIMAVLSIIVFVNFKTFSQDQILNKALGQIQSFLREAQSNATASLACGGSGGVSWAVKFSADKVNLELVCGSSDSVKKTLTLDNVDVYSLQCSPSSTDSTCPPVGATFNPPLTISFAPLYGNVGFSACSASTLTLKVALRNLKNNNYKCFTVSKGGAIDVQ